MTSPVDTSVKYFTSDMIGAPALSGTVGSLISVLNACLVDGFDLKTLTSLVVAAGIATATYSGTHSALPESVVLVAGVTGGPTGFAGLNGEQKIIGKPSPNAVTFATALPDGTYTGTISIKMAPLGWLKPFTGTNLAAYKSADPSSTGCLLRVDDTNALYGRVVGYESMSDISTGLGIFPTAVQVAGGGVWHKSSQASATAVGWAIIGDGSAFYYHMQPSRHAGAAYLTGSSRGFGDAIGFKPGGDQFRAFLNYSITVSAGAGGDGQLDGISAATQTASPRSYLGLGTAVLQVVVPYTGAAVDISGFTNNMGTFPSPVDGSLRLSRKFLASLASGAPPRADLPGFYHCPQSLVQDTLKFGNLVIGSNSLAGRMLLTLTPATAGNLGVIPTSSNSGASFVDITGPWR